MELEEVLNEANIVNDTVLNLASQCHAISQQMNGLRKLLSSNNDTGAISKELAQYIEYYEIVYQNIQNKYNYLADRMKEYVNQSRENARIAQEKLQKLNATINDMLSALQQAF